MPRVDIPLSGWQQQPAEQTGAPRITRITNCCLDNAGKILKSPGQAQLPTNSESGTIASILAVGEQFQILGDSFGVRQPGFRFARLNNNTWNLCKNAWDYTSTVEAPRMRKIFSETDAHFMHSGIMDLGNGLYIAYAERFPAHGNNTLRWALISAVNGMAIVKRGEIDTGSSGTDPVYLQSAGPFIGYLEGLYVKLWKWNPAISDFAYIARYPTNEAGYQFSMTYSAAWNRIFLIGDRGQITHINSVTGSEVETFTKSYLNSISGSPVFACGTCSISIFPGCDTGVGPAILWTAQYSATTWGVNIATVLASGNSGVFQSIIRNQALYVNNNSTYGSSNLPNAATGSKSNKRVALGLNASTNELACVIPVHIIAQSLASEDIVWDSVVAEFDASGTFKSYGPNGTTNPVRGYYPATTPTVDATNGPVWWSWDGNPKRSLRTSSLMSEGFISTDRRIASTPAAKTLVCIGGDPGVTPAVGDVGISGPMVRSEYLGSTRPGLFASGWIAALPVQRSASAAECDIYLSTVVDGRTIVSSPSENLPDVLQSASARGQTIYACGAPIGYTTDPDFCGALEQPPPPLIYIQGVNLGLWDGAESLTCCVASKFTDGNGNVFWSPVSDLVTYKPAANALAVAQVRYPANIPQFSRCEHVLFQRINGVFYDTMGLGLLPAAFAISAGILSSPILYTQGKNGSLSGQLEKFGCPPCRTIWTGRDRMIAGGLANECRVQWSNTYFPTEGISWPQDAAFYCDLDEPITAVAAIDDWWVVFSNTSIWLISGSGPDALGNGTFDTPLRISNGLGCPSWRSVAETPIGLVFQGNNGQIYTLQAGSRTPVLISQGIRDSLCNASESAAVVLPPVWVQGVCFDPTRQEVWFQTSDRDFVYQCEFGSWREERYDDSSPGSPLGLSYGSLGSFTGPVNCRASLTTRPRRPGESFYYTDCFGQPRTMFVTTNDIDLSPHGRIRRVEAKVVNDKHLQTVTPSVSAEFWFDGKHLFVPSDATVSMGGNSSTDYVSFFQVEGVPTRQKCNQVKVRLSIGVGPVDGAFDAGWAIDGFSLDLETNKGKPVKYTAGTGRMS